MAQDKLLKKLLVQLEAAVEDQDNESKVWFGISIIFVHNCKNIACFSDSSAGVGFAPGAE